MSWILARQQVESRGNEQPSKQRGNIDYCNFLEVSKRNRTEACDTGQFWVRVTVL